MRTCHWCGRQVPAEDFCPDCLAAFPNRPEPGTMTPDEREAEFRGLEYLEVPLDMIHDRIEKLVGRPVWTHEMGTSNVERLAKECRWEARPATMQEILDVIPPEKRIVVVGPDND